MLWKMIIAGAVLYWIYRNLDNGKQPPQQDGEECGGNPTERVLLRTWPSCELLLFRNGQGFGNGSAMLTMLAGKLRAYTWSATQPCHLHTGKGQGNGSQWTRYKTQKANYKKDASNYPLC
eukprot:TRINITY_DN7882_c0_g2_i4.p1 TRINITY_DN7882_c0_g2~~TRINITY_DN7882_c0_g2_i4.p1  ORF type:complete len:120 (+),score=12.53 TRINITY_DN7882_c0_g2_i4:51-410(+)